MYNIYLRRSKKKVIGDKFLKIFYRYCLKILFINIVYKYSLWILIYLINKNIFIENYSVKIIYIIFYCIIYIYEGAKKKVAGDKFIFKKLSAENNFFHVFYFFMCWE